MKKLKQTIKNLLGFSPEPTPKTYEITIRLRRGSMDQYSPEIIKYISDTTPIIFEGVVTGNAEDNLLIPLDRVYDICYKEV